MDLYIGGIAQLRLCLLQNHKIQILKLVPCKYQILSRCCYFPGTVCIKCCDPAVPCIWSGIVRPSLMCVKER